MIRRLPGWTDSAADTIVTVRHRPWGQIWRFRRRVPLLHSAPERFDHGEQHSPDGSEQERDCRRQVPVSAEVADVRALAFFQDEDQQEQQQDGTQRGGDPHRADPGTFRPLLRGCGGLGWTMFDVPPGSALETAIGLTNLTALTRTAPASEQQGCDPSVTVSS